MREVERYEWLTWMIERVGVVTHEDTLAFKIVMMRPVLSFSLNHSFLSLSFFKGMVNPKWIEKQIIYTTLTRHGGK